MSVSIITGHAYHVRGAPMRHPWFAVYSPVSTRVLLVQLGIPGAGFPVTKPDCSFSLTAAAVSALLLSLFDFFCMLV